MFGNSDKIKSVITQMNTSLRYYVNKSKKEAITKSVVYGLYFSSVYITAHSYFYLLRK